MLRMLSVTTTPRMGLKCQGTNEVRFLPGDLKKRFANFVNPLVYEQGRAVTK
jgi:hypothetical protein